MAHKVALLIGVNEYTLIGKVHYARQDAEGIAEALREYWGFDPDEEIILMTCGKTNQFLPTLNHIERQFRLLRDARQDVEFLMVGFWGHGFLHKGSRYLCAVDTDEENLVKTGIAYDSIVAMAKQVCAQNTCLILDCCQNHEGRGHAEAFSEAEHSKMQEDVANAPRDVLASRREKGYEVVRPPTFAIWNSCAPGERAYEWDDRLHGIFTAHLIDGIAKCPESINRLAGYVSQNVAKTARRLAKTQTPNILITSEDGGDIPLPGSVQTPPTPPNGIDMANLIAEARKRAEEEAAKIIAEAQKEAERIRTQVPVAPVVPTKAKQREANRIRAQAVPVTPPRPQIQQGNKAGERMSLTIKGVEYVFRWCPAGSFMMGSPNDELGRLRNEAQHRVTLTHGFWMLETQVTQSMWERVMGSNPSRFKEAKLPVEKVSWDDCQGFLEKLSDLSAAPSGYRFSLPTEAQWEYACRAGTTTALNSGKNLKDVEYNCPNLHEVGWYDWQNENKMTHPVGLKRANAWGLYDMHGNVWEWCSDWYGVYPSGAVTDPAGTSSAPERVFRGGSWGLNAMHCRSALRNGRHPSSRYDSIGLRLALVRERE